MRNDLDQVAIVNQNKHAGQDGQGFPQQVVRQASNDPGTDHEWSVPKCFDA
jgi:hypothetical protein